MLGTFLSWLAAAAFLFVGAVGLVRPDQILAIRAYLRRIHDADRLDERRRSKFGIREVRICALVLLLIGAALVRSLSHG